MGEVADVGEVGFECDFVEGLVVDEDLTGVGAEVARDQFDESGFAAAGVADEGGFFAGGDFEGEILENFLVGIVAESQVTDGDFAV